MAQLPIYLTNGFVIGAIYALSALGVSLIVGVMRVVNFAHGELYLLGGYFSYELSVRCGVPPVPAMILSVAALFVVGLALERTLIRNTYGDETRSLIVTFVLSIVLQNALLLGFGPYPHKPTSLVEGTMRMFGLFDYGNQRLLSLLLAAACLGLVFFLIERTWFGKGLRAVAQDRAMASLCGIDAERLNSVAFGLGCALAGAAGVLVSPIFALTPAGGSAVSLNAFVVVVLGGMGSLKGCVAGGLLLGLIENLGAAYVSTMYRDIFGFLILVLVLALRPQGLYGKRA